jgi:hypothetical protein
MTMLDSADIGNDILLIRVQILTMFTKVLIKCFEFIKFSLPINIVYNVLDTAELSASLTYFIHIFHCYVVA